MNAAIAAQMIGSRPDDGYDDLVAVCAKYICV